MNTSMSWTKAYVPDLDCTAQEYTDAMTLTGTKVEGYRELDRNLKGIVVGEVLSIEKHPDADKLIICRVNIGDREVQIVTGAHNFQTGDKVPVVLAGGKVAGGHDGSPLPEDGIRIEKGKLRGVESDGMMCSIEELGSSRYFYPEAPENGIYVFPKDVKIGEDAAAVLGLHDTVFEYEITSNRVDCYSGIGVAREAAATFHKEFHLPEVRETGNGEDIHDFLSVEVKDHELCSRYCARMVKDIRLAPSPEWMQRRLSSCGIRPINNIVDITNYVMEEYGQPMHAFDYDRIAGQKIIVRRAKDGDTFRTLDGQERNLDHDILMICDGEKEIGIAGIMGGENSKITDDAKTMIFESACFNGTNIRLSAKRLGLRTDASGKFEKGLDPNNSLDAINRACSLITELGAGTVVGNTIDIYPEKVTESRVPFDPDAINRLLGTDIAKEEMLKYFNKIELKYDAGTNEIAAPTFRQDIHCEADLAEEVARFYGYDKIPTTLPNGEATMGGISRKLEVEQIAKDTAKFSGFSESMSYSFESPKVFDKLELPADAKERRAIKIMNPLGEDFSIMRTLPLNGLLQSLSNNYNRRNKNVKLFEMANIYLPKALPLTELPDERMQFTLGFYGEGDFYGMKGVIEEFFEEIGLNGSVCYDPDCDRPYLHPGRKADVLYDGNPVGYLGEVHPDVAENYAMEDAVYIAVIDMPSIYPLANFERKYTGIAKFPAVTRDMSLVVPTDILAGQIEGIIKKDSRKIMESCELFDIYEGDQIRKGFKSLAYTITFRSRERTLEDREVQDIMDKIVSDLKEKGVELRS